MIIKYSVGNGTVLIIMFILMIIKYNSSEKTKYKKKRKDIKIKNDDDLFGYGQYVIIDN